MTDPPAGRSHASPIFRGNQCLCLMALCFWAPVPHAEALFMDAPEWMGQASDVVKQQDLTTAQKIERLDRIIPDDVPLSAKARYLYRVDPDTAVERLTAAFDDESIPMHERLRIADRILLMPGSRRSRADADDQTPAQHKFVERYYPWLLEQAVAREDRMIREPTTRHRPTPITKLIHVASEGAYPDPDDKADVIRLLIKALALPDNVYPDPAKFNQDGPPGEPTGRNTDRQAVPYALARLEATEAVPELTDALKNHQDWYLRDNAAYALGVLMPQDELQQIIEYLQSPEINDPPADPLWRTPRFHLYAVGRGMVEAGNDAGIAYFVPRYSHHSKIDSISNTFYMLNQRIDELEDVRSPKVASFVRAMLAHDPIWRVFTPAPDPEADNTWRERSAIEAHAELCDLIEANAHFTEVQQLRPLLEKLAEQAQIEAIRDRTETCIDRLRDAKG